MCMLKRKHRRPVLESAAVIHGIRARSAPGPGRGLRGPNDPMFGGGGGGGQPGGAGAFWARRDFRGLEAGEAAGRVPLELGVFLQAAGTAVIAHEPPALPYQRHLPSRRDQIPDVWGGCHALCGTCARTGGAGTPATPTGPRLSGGWGCSPTLLSPAPPQPQRYRCIIPAHRGPPRDRLVSHVTDYSRAPTANQGPNPRHTPVFPTFSRSLCFSRSCPGRGGGRGLTGGFTGKGSGLRGGRRRRRLLSAGGRGQEGVRTGGLRRFVGRGIRPPPVLIGQNVQQLPAPGRFPAAKEGASSPYILIRRGCTIGASWR